MIISEAMAAKYFGNEHPVGKILRDDNTQVPLTVTGVFRTFPFPTHLQFDYLLSMRTIDSYQDEQTMERRTWSGFYTYVVLKNQHHKKTIEDRMPNFMLTFYASTGESKTKILTSRRLHLQPITDIHLHSRLEKEMHPNSDITYVYVFSIAAFFIVLIASINFINMSTANAFNRTKEIGVRKVAGATKKQLVSQFLGESLIITLIAAAVSLLLLQGGIPFYNTLTGKNFAINDLWNASDLIVLLVLILVIGVLAGLYPAWFISRFNSAASLKAKPAAAASHVNVTRKALVVFQFTVSVFMIFSTIVVYRQLRFFHQKELGFDKEQLIAVKLYSDTRSKLNALLSDMTNTASIADFSLVSVLPGERFSTQPFLRAGETNDDDKWSTRIMWSDEKLLGTLHIELKAGRNFFRQSPDIQQNEFLINEATVNAFGLKNPVGSRFICDRDTGIVVGIVRDFNFASLHSPIDPLVIQYQPYRTNYLLVKTKAGQLPQALDFIKATFKALSPSAVFNYTFVDEQLNRLYASENRMSDALKAFAAFAIFISSLGLFALSAYTARVRTKEVGIRKVLGATVSSVVLLLSKDFVKLVAIAIAVALPLAWLAMNTWLEQFAYRIAIHPIIFILSALLAMVVALLTVLYQGIRAAQVNPVKSLKTE